MFLESIPCTYPFDEFFLLLFSILVLGNVKATEECLGLDLLLLTKSGL